MNCHSRIRRVERGLTLVELLVAIVILGLLMTLVSQAIYQVAQIARAAQGASQELHGRWGGGWSVSALLANLVAPTEVTGTVFTGSSSRISGYSTLSLGESSTGIAPFALSLERSTRAPQEAAKAFTDLTHTRQGESARRAEAPTVARFSGVAEFAFMDRAGAIKAIWPAGPSSGADAEVLPRAVVVRDIESGRILMWYGFQGDTARQEGSFKPFWDSQK